MLLLVQLVVVLVTPTIATCLLTLVACFNEQVASRRCVVEPRRSLNNVWLAVLSSPLGSAHHCLLSQDTFQFPLLRRARCSLFPTFISLLPPNDKPGCPHAAAHLQLDPAIVCAANCGRTQGSGRISRTSQSASHLFSHRTFSFVLVRLLQIADISPHSSSMDPFLSPQVPDAAQPGPSRQHGARPVSVQPTSSSATSQSASRKRASHNVVTSQPQEEQPGYRDIYSHPAALEYAAAHPRRTIPKFGPYLLLQTLGEGEFGKVKLGLHMQWGEEVAVKLIRRGNIDSSVRMSKVEREIEVLRVRALLACP